MMNIKEVEIQKEYVRKWICASTNHEMFMRVCVQRVEEKKCTIITAQSECAAKKIFSGL